MKRFILEQSNDEFYTSHSGLALVGACINRYSGLGRTLGRVAQGSDHIAEIDVIRSYLGLLCLGKGLLGQHTPIRHPAKRRRIKTVIQELIYLAARLISTGRRFRLRFSRHCPAFAAFAAVYNRLLSAH